jgi:hypothetical protein
MTPAVAKSKLWGCLGCSSLTLVFGVPFVVGGATDFKTGFASLGALFLVWVAAAVVIDQKRQAVHKRERQAIRDAEVAQHEAFMAAKEAERVARYHALVARYGQAAADGIVRGRYWQGATAEMIRESLGAPADIREKVYKSKTKTTYCYRQVAKNRYELRIHFEDYVVVGWDD